MTDGDVERALGYTPCVCGVIDGTWHSKCYRDKTQEQISAGYKLAFAKARRYLKDIRVTALRAAMAPVRGPEPK